MRVDTQSRKVTQIPKADIQKMKSVHTKAENTKKAAPPPAPKQKQPKQSTQPKGPDAHKVPAPRSQNSGQTNRPPRPPKLPGSLPSRGSVRSHRTPGPVPSHVRPQGSRPQIKITPKRPPKR